MLSPYDQGMTAMARTERSQLCDVALEVGESEPTLCGEWTVKELVVHLLVRERSPLGAPGILVPALEKLTDGTSRRLAGRTDFPVLVERLRQGPPVWSPLGWGPVDGIANTVEFFVHHEDIRRARPEWTPRELSSYEQAALWARLKVLGRSLVRNAGVGVVLERTDRRDRVVVKKGGSAVVVRGLPSELTLFLFGRKAQADVELDGAPDDVAAFEGASLGL